MGTTPDDRRDGVAAWAAVLRVHAALVPLLSQRLFRATGMSLAWYDVLLELQAADGRRLRLLELGERVVLSRSRVSRIVDELVAAGFVVRAPDPDDGRATFAVLTDAGLTAFRAAAPVYIEAITEQFVAHLTQAEIRAVARGLGRVADRHGS